MKRVAVIGGGVAGMQTALRLAEQGVEPVIIEKEAELGGKLRGWHVLFPSFTPASEILTELRRRIAERGIEVMTRTEARGFSREGVQLPDGRMLACDSVVVCSGFTLFDASIKEEYGYGIYDNVFTTVDIERMLNEGRVAKADGSRPKRIAFLHCVGSRDEKVCQQHCSKVCCITGVKQAMEMRQMFPEADVFNFYMDIRMFGPGYEEMYREAQQKYNIHFIRGRISEASPMIDGRVQIKAEDTLTGRPLRMSVDMLILIVGMRANDDNAAFAQGAGLNRAPSGFMAPRDMFLGNVKSNVEGIFYAGTVTAPKNRRESERRDGRRRCCGPVCRGLAYGSDQFRIYHLQAAGNRHRPQQPAQERRDPARDARVAGLYRLRRLHGGLYGGQSHGIQLPQGTYAGAARRIPGGLRGDEQVHAVRQMPSGMSARDQYARRGDAYQT